MTPEKVVIAVNGKSFSNDRHGGAIRAALNIINGLNDIYGDRTKELEILIPSYKEIPHQLFESKSIRVRFCQPSLCKYIFQKLLGTIYSTFLYQ
ncbi:MAG: hypothetical protein HC763_22150 [Hydrococcus sp. CRU_1_1]|nr:hypothetical protein [Hydrococcus sp. CRU_1_1]